MQQHQQQLVSLQQHKQQLEKHKKELEDLSMWSMFPGKFLSKVSDPAGIPWMSPPTILPPFPPPFGTPMTSTSTPINLAQQKKQVGSTRKQDRTTGMPAPQPVQQHLMQVRVGSKIACNVIRLEISCCFHLKLIWRICLLPLRYMFSAVLLCHRVMWSYNVESQQCLTSIAAVTESV